jgi:hypothetical protein
MLTKKKTKLPINVLVNHLKNYKDAVIVLGPDVIKDTDYCEINEETYDSYNRKLMIKEPNKFWNFYVDKIMIPIAATNKITAQINRLLEMNVHSFIIDTNIVKTVMNDEKREDLISPNGKNNILECVKCHKTFEANKMIDELKSTEKTLKCECGGNIKPTVLYHGEKYNMNMYKAVKDAIFKEENDKPELNTHTLIFIGVDFTDTLISELIDSYDALKDNNHFTVIVTDKLNRDDLIYYNPEFGVTDDLDQAIDRLIDLIK